MRRTSPGADFIGTLLSRYRHVLAISVVLVGVLLAGAGVFHAAAAPQLSTGMSASGSSTTSGGARGISAQTDMTQTAGAPLPLPAKAIGTPGDVARTLNFVGGPSGPRYQGDPYSPQQGGLPYSSPTANPWYGQEPYGYLYRVDVPATYTNTQLYVEIFDPDSYNKPATPPPWPTGTATSVPTADQYASCTNPSSGGCTSSGPAGDEGMKVNAFPSGKPAYWRVDRYFCNYPDIFCAARYSSANAVTTQYTLWHFDPGSDNVLADPSTLSDSLGGAYLSRYTVRDDPSTDLSWYRPNGYSLQLQGTQGAPCPNGSTSGDCFARQSNGDFYFYVYVQSLDGPSYNAFELRAGPPQATYDCADPRNCYVNQQYLDNTPGWVDGNVTVSALPSLPLKLTQDYGNASPVLLTQLNSDMQGQVVGIRHFDMDASSPPAILTYQMQKSGCEDLADDNCWVDVATGTQSGNDTWAWPGYPDPEQVQVPAQVSPLYTQVFGSGGGYAVSWLRLKQDPSSYYDDTVWETRLLPASVTPTSTSTATPTFSATATSTATSTATDTQTPTSTSTLTAISTSTSTDTLTPTSTRTATPVPTRTSTRTVTATSTATPSATNTQTVMATVTVTFTASSTHTSTTSVPTLIPTGTATATATSTDTPTSTTTATTAPSLTPTAMETPSGTATLPSQATPSLTSTAIAQPGTATSTSTPSPTATVSSVPTVTLTPTAQPSSSATSTAQPTACTIQFADVPPPPAPGSTYYTSARCLVCRGIVSGYPCGGVSEPCDAAHDPYYRPGANITRGQLSKIVASAAGLTTPPPAGRQSFEDVLPTDPFYLYIEDLAAAGAISGYRCDRAPAGPCDSQHRPYFLPGANTTRGQISKIADIAAGFSEPVPATQQTFSDVPSSSPFWQYIERLAGRHIIDGYNDVGHCSSGATPCFLYNTFTTRGQMAKIAAATFLPDCQTPDTPTNP